MSERRQAMPVRVFTGGNAVIRYGGTTAVLVGGNPVLLSDIRDRIQEAAGAADAPDQVALALEQAHAEGVEAAAVVLTDDGAEAILSGDVDVRCELGYGELQLNARGLDSVVRHPIAGGYTAVTVGAIADPGSETWWELQEGYVPGAAVLVTLDAEPGVSPAPRPLRVADPVPAAPPEPEAAAEAEPATIMSEDEDEASDAGESDESFDSIVFAEVAAAPEDLRTPLPEADAEVAPDADSDEPGELVQGLSCSRGHFNHPLSANCAWCGISMAQASHVLVRGQRPPLGVLVVNGHTTFTLDGDYVIGRQPGLDGSVDGRRVRALPLLDEQRGVSRVHAKVRLADWDVFVEDLGSGIGTWIVAQTGLPPARLESGREQLLQPGDQLLIGPHQLTYHSHHLR